MEIQQDPEVLTCDTLQETLNNYMKDIIPRAVDDTCPVCDRKLLVHGGGYGTLQWLSERPGYARCSECWLSLQIDHHLIHEGCSFGVCEVRVKLMIRTVSDEDLSKLRALWKKFGASNRERYQAGARKILGGVSAA